MIYMLIALAVIVALAAIVLVVGYLLPVKHVASVRAVLNCSVEPLWQRLISFTEYPSWRRNIAQVTPASAGTWKEVDKQGDAVLYETVELLPQQRLVRRIASKDLPFGGTWTIELAPVGPKQTQVNISEAGEVYNPIFRFVSTFITGRHGSMSAFVEDLARIEGGTTQIEKC